MDRSVLIVRIYLKEADHGRRKSLMQEILSVLHDQHRVKAVTVFRGIAGFDESGEIHASDILRLSVDLPLVIEFFDETPVAEVVIKVLNDLVPEGHMIYWPAKSVAAQS